MSRSSNEPLLPGLRRKGIIDMEQLDELLDCEPERFEARVEALVNELDRADARLTNTAVARTRGKGPRAGARDHYTGQVMALPQLDRQGEMILARRYALTRRRFLKALAMMEVKGAPKDPGTFLCPQFQECRDCAGTECCKWKRSLGTRAAEMLQRRCREFHTVRNAFIEGSLYIVILALNNIPYLSIPREDLIQEGNASLFRAVDKYDWRKGVRFRTYAEYWVNQSFMEAIYNQSRTVRVPAWVHKTTRKIRKLREQARIVSGEEPGDAAVARALQLDPEKIGEILRDNRHSFSMDQLPDQDRERGSSLADCLAAADDTSAEAVARETAHLLPRRLQAALDSLAGREQEVIRSRFGLDGRQVSTLSEMGRRLGVSAERVRQIQETALAKLRGRSEELLLDAL